MHTKPVESCTCYQCEWARAHPAAQTALANALSIHRTSKWENSLSKLKDDSHQRTAQRCYSCGSLIRGSTCEFCFNPTTGQQANTPSGIADGRPGMTSFPTSAEPSPKSGSHLPTDAASRKRIPLYSGLVKYFPDALVAVASLSYVGNAQHNAGSKLHWDRSKSTDQEDTLLRHLFEAGTVDCDGVRHSTKVAWRALALLQLELEKSRAD
jgi:hypothetical protein